MKKRILTLALALAMALTFSVPALAADDSILIEKPLGTLKDIEATVPQYADGIATFMVVITYDIGTSKAGEISWSGAEGDVLNETQFNINEGTSKTTTVIFDVEQVENAQIITFTATFTTPNDIVSTKSIEVPIAALGMEEYDAGNGEDDDVIGEEEDDADNEEEDVHICIPGDRVVLRAATCTEKGAWEIRCADADCDELLESGEIELNGHKYTGIVTAPTCTEEGFTTYTCGVCGDTYKDDIVVANGHTDGARVDTLDPTCTAEGEWEIRCIDCDVLLDSGAIAALGHDYLPVSARTSSTNLQNITTVTITVDGKCSECGDMMVLASASVKLKQNGKQIVNIGGYNVTVVVNDNNKITDIYVGAPAASAGNAQNNNSQGGNNNSQR